MIIPGGYKAEAAFLTLKDPLPLLIAVDVVHIAGRRRNFAQQMYNFQLAIRLNINHDVVHVIKNKRRGRNPKLEVYVVNRLDLFEDIINVKHALPLVG